MGLQLILRIGPKQAMPHNRRMWPQLLTLHNYSPGPLYQHAPASASRTALCAASSCSCSPLSSALAASSSWGRGWWCVCGVWVGGWEGGLEPGKAVLMSLSR